MSSLIKHLSPIQQKDLFEQLNYLNIGEYTSLCKRFQISIKIFVELDNGKFKKTSDKDRKGVILKKIKSYLLTDKQPKPTMIPKKVVNFAKLPSSLKKQDKLHYGQYDRNNREFFKLLGQLTNGAFKDGAIARHVIRDFWISGKAPTLEQFARAWVKATKDHKKPKPEWAFLTDRFNGFSEGDWKKLRIKKANAALKILKSI